jgi:hypothetical protein
MHTALIIARSGSTFSVTQVEYDPHTSQGAKELQDKLNQVSVGGQTILQVIDAPK